MPNRIIKRAIAIVSAAGTLVGFGARALALEPTGGLLNRPFAEIQKSQFVTWFQFAETHREPVAGGGEKIDFQPTGDKFHDLALIAVTVNPAMVIQRMDLVLKRSFIASPANGIFASDLAKSFVRGVPSSDDSEAMGTLADEIQYRAKSSQTVLIGPGYSPPALPDPPTASYQTYLGQRRTNSKKLSHCLFSIENEQQAGIDQLRINFTAK